MNECEKKRQRETDSEWQRQRRMRDIICTFGATAAAAVAAYVAFFVPVCAMF